MRETCRTCLKLVEGFNFLYLNNDSSIIDKLTFCIPTINVHRLPNPVMCKSCITALNTAYEFTCQCLLTEEYLRHPKILRDEEADKGTSQNSIQGFKDQIPLKRAKRDSPTSTTTWNDILHNNNAFSEEKFTVTKVNFSIQEEVLNTKDMSQNATSSEILVLDAGPNPEYHSEIICLPECRVVVTPLEVDIKQSLKKQLRSIYNEPDCNGNDSCNESTSQNLLLRECRVVVTPLEHILRQAIRRDNFNKDG